MRRNRRKQPARQSTYRRTYIRLSARVDRLEDAMSHFYNVINGIAQARFDAGEEVKAFSQKIITLME